MWCIVHVGHINKPQRRLSLGLRLSVPGILFMSIATSTVKCHLLVNGQTLKATVVYMCTWMFTAGVCGCWWHIGPSQYRRRPDVISVQSVDVVYVCMNVCSWFVWTLVAHWARSISSPTRRDISTIRSCCICVCMNVCSWCVWTLVAHWAQSISSPTWCRISTIRRCCICVRVNVYSWCVWTLVAHWAQSISSPTRRHISTIRRCCICVCLWMFTAGVCGRWWHIGPGQYRRRPDVISVQSVDVVYVCAWMFTAGLCGRWWHTGPSQYRRRLDVVSVQSLFTESCVDKRCRVHAPASHWVCWVHCRPSYHQQSQGTASK